MYFHHRKCTSRSKIANTLKETGSTAHLSLPVLQKKEVAIIIDKHVLFRLRNKCIGKCGQCLLIKSTTCDKMLTSRRINNCKQGLQNYLKSWKNFKKGLARLITKVSRMRRCTDQRVIQMKRQLGTEMILLMNKHDFWRCLNPNEWDYSVYSIPQQTCTRADKPLNFSINA